jgi:hypothetical protein
MSAKKKAKGTAAKSAKPAKGRAGNAKAKSAKAKPGARSKPNRKPTAKKLAAKKPAPSKVAAKKPAPKKIAAKKPGATKKVAAKKPTATKMSVVKKAVPVSTLNGKPAMKRRDATGHLDPAYAADLRARIEEGHPKDDDRGFAKDALSDELGEEFVETVTSGEDEGTEIRDQDVTEELGGPFTVTTGGTEFARDVDESNPKGATREPFPRS